MFNRLLFLFVPPSLEIHFRVKKFDEMKYLFFVLILCNYNTLLGQPIGKEKYSEITLGYALTAEKLPEGYDYAPFFLTGRFTVHQFSTSKKSTLNVFVEPQLILNTPSSPFKKSYEFGANLGLQCFFPLSKKNGFAASIGVGPHYLSLETAMQAKGFIFSDNFEVGYYQKLKERWGFTIKPRFRHISNAGFLSPNLGIDNFFVFVGIFWKSS